MGSSSRCRAVAWWSWHEARCAKRATIGRGVRPARAFPSLLTHPNLTIEDLLLREDHVRAGRPLTSRRWSPPHTQIERSLQARRRCVRSTPQGLASVRSAWGLGAAGTNQTGLLLLSVEAVATNRGLCVQRTTAGCADPPRRAFRQTLDEKRRIYRGRFSSRLGSEAARVVIEPQQTGASRVCATASARCREVGITPDMPVAESEHGSRPIRP
jgi:hypothetical protein